MTDPYRSLNDPPAPVCNCCYQKVIDKLLTVIESYRYNIYAVRSDFAYHHLPAAYAALEKETSRLERLLKEKQ